MLTDCPALSFAKKYCNEYCTSCLDLTLLHVENKHCNWIKKLYKLHASSSDDFKNCTPSKQMLRSGKTQMQLHLNYSLQLHPSRAQHICRFGLIKMYACIEQQKATNLNHNNCYLSISAMDLFRLD